MADSQSAEQRNSQITANQPYDEAIEVGDEEEVPSIASPIPAKPQGRSHGDTPPESKMSDGNTDDEFETGTGQPRNEQACIMKLLFQQSYQGRPGNAMHGRDYDESHADEDGDLSADSESGVQGESEGMQGGMPGSAGGGNPQRPAKNFGQEEDEDSSDESDDSEDDEEGGTVEGKKKHHHKARPPQPLVGTQEQTNVEGGGGGGLQVAAPPMAPPRPLDAPAPVQAGDPAARANEQSAPAAEEAHRAYDPADYDHLAVTPEIKELFQYITRYTPQTVELDYKLKPFIPDYIPCVGDIDAFLKADHGCPPLFVDRYTPQNVELDYHFKPFIPDYIPSIGDVDAFLKIPMPDGKPDTLGLTVLDEPCARQSDPTVLDLQLRQVSKQTNLKQMVVKSVKEADKNPKSIDNWIKSISDLHKSKPPPNVHYTKNMPDIDKLMQEWPPEFEELLKEVDLPTAELDCDLSTYVDIICTLLDIPIYKSKVQSLHVLFTLFSEFKNSQHFRSLASQNQLDNLGGGGGPAADSEDRLVL